jgi:hypothetical protein
VGDQLGDSEGRLGDGPAGGAVGAGEREGGDVGALDLAVPAVGAVGAARDRLEIEQGAEGFEGVLAGEALPGGAGACLDPEMNSQMTR